jgi:transcriptional regulator with XRE-family HTH domain
MIFTGIMRQRQGGDVMVDLKKTGAFIAECRKKKNMTQKELGERLRVTDRAVSKWETGRSFPDVNLLEDLCRELDISVGDLLAGKKLEPEQYQEETEKMLVANISSGQLYGFQIILYLLTAAAVIMVDIPFLLDHEGILPDWNPITGCCWVSGIVVAICTTYLDKKIPGREFRMSNPLMEGVAGGLYFLFLMLFNDMIAGRNIAPTEEEKFTEAVIIAICLIFVVGIRALMALSRRKELKEWERYGK